MEHEIGDEVVAPAAVPAATEDLTEDVSRTPIDPMTCRLSLLLSAASHLSRTLTHFASIPHIPHILLKFIYPAHKHLSHYIATLLTLC